VNSEHSVFLGKPCFAKKQVQRQAEVAEIKDIVGLPD
jgi:hypothetical protein